MTRKAATKKKKYLEKLQARKQAIGHDLQELFHRGIQLHQAKRLNRAKAVYQQILEIQPDHFDAHNNLGVVLMEQGRPDEAVVCYRKALAIRQDYALAQSNLGDALMAEGNVDEAVAWYERVLESHPNELAVLSTLGAALTSKGRIEEAVARFRRAVEIAPEDPEILTDFGTALQADGQTKKAVTAYERALAVSPDFVEAHYNLGVLQEERGEVDPAIESYRRAISADPHHAMARVNLGMMYQMLGRISDAETCFRDAVAAAPEHAPAHHNLGLLLLLQGKFAEGWPENEWRLRTEGQTPMRDYRQPLWRGEAVQGKTVLVWGEQGVGDEIQFAGMVPDLIEASAGVILESDPRLVPLFQRSFPGAECIARSKPPDLGVSGKRIDFHVPAGGLCRWLRSDLGSFPERRSYLVADDNRRRALREKYLEGGGDVLVGIAWTSKNLEVGRKRSIPLIKFLPLTNVPGTRFVNLQYGDTADERAAFEKETGVPIIHDDLVDPLADMDAFAAQLAAMDLVISIDNSTVHVASALGVSTWIMLDSVPHFVWMLDRDDSPWYPSVRLYRQTEAGQWTDVIERVTARLADFAGGSERD